MRSDLTVGWRRVPLSEVIDFQEGPGIMARDFRDQGVPLIRLAGVTADSLLEGCNFLDPLMVERRWAHFRLEEGDTLLSTSASLGRISCVGPDAAGAVAYTGLIRMRPRDHRVVRTYVRYLLASPMFQEQIEAMGAGSVMRHFGPTHLRQMHLDVPSVSEQQRIAAVLDALNGKIDSNRRLAALLEQVAGTEFCARFVDFVGVEGLTESEGRPVPQGWNLGALAEIAAVHKHLLSGPSDRPYIGLDAMPRGSTILTEWRTKEAPSGQSVAFEQGDILFGKLRPYFKKVGVAPIAGRCSSEILVLRPTVPEYYGVVLGHVASQSFIDYCVAVSRGTRMPRAEWKDASTFALAVPPTAVAGQFTGAVRSIYQKIFRLTQATHVLIDIRDALLPELISGEIRVPDTADTDEVIGPAGEQLAAQ